MRAHAVLVPLSPRLERRARNAAAREAVAEALRASAARAGAPRALPCEAWPRTEAGAPAPVHGWHASWSDTRGLVAALVAPVAVGLDAEWLARPRIEAARALFRASGELARLRSAEPREVLALWSAKEALLKLAGVGLADLGRCPLRSRESETYRLEHAGRLHDVRVRFEGAHVLAWTSASPLAVAWHVLQEVP